MSERAYRIDPAQPVPDEVRRVARGRIDHAIDELRGTSDSTRAEAVHEARKDMKKLRALLRLVRDELGEDVYRRENDCFRDTARTLSGLRDAEVMLATLGGPGARLRRAARRGQPPAPRRSSRTASGCQGRRCNRRRRRRSRRSRRRASGSRTGRCTRTASRRSRAG